MKLFGVKVRLLWITIGLMIVKMRLLVKKPALLGW